VVFAGFVVANSETGCGAATVTPRLVAQVCANGMTVTRDAVRAVHLGERMDEGIRWSGDTQDRQLALVTAKARDAVRAFLSPGYVERVVRDLEKQAWHRVADAAQTVEVISARLGTARPGHPGQVPLRPVPGSAEAFPTDRGEEGSSS
jgi:hypothetical protein